MLYRPPNHYRADNMKAALEHYNNIIRKLSIEYSIPLFDLEKEIPGTLQYFYDDVHFNNNGARTAGMMLAKFILKSCK